MRVYNRVRRRDQKIQILLELEKRSNSLTRARAKVVFRVSRILVSSPEPTHQAYNLSELRHAAVIVEHRYCMHILASIALASPVDYLELMICLINGSSQAAKLIITKWELLTLKLSEVSANLKSCAVPKRILVVPHDLQPMTRFREIRVAAVGSERASKQGQSSKSPTQSKSVEVIMVMHVV